MLNSVEGNVLRIETLYIIGIETLFIMSYRRTNKMPTIEHKKVKKTKNFYKYLVDMSKIFTGKCTNHEILDTDRS